MVISSILRTPTIGKSMPIKSIKVIIITFLFLNLTACSTMDSSLLSSKENISTIIGGITGAALGNKLGNKKHRKVWTLAGGALGAYVGKRIGRYLDKQDQQRMAQTTRRVAISGKPQTWSNPKNKTKGKARVIATKTKKVVVKVPVLKSKVKKVPPLDIIGRNYRANRLSNVRGGPGTNYVRVGKLNKGEVISVVGKVKTRNWYLISQDGVGSGFVHSKLVDPTRSRESSGKKVSQNDVAVQHVSTTQVCRTIEQSVTLANGSTQSETIEACKGKNGWEART